MANELTDDDSSAEQLPLIPTSDMPDEVFFAEEYDRGNYTLERLRKYKPEVYAQVISCLAEGLSMRATARMCKVARETVAQIQEVEVEAIRPLKEMMAGKTRIAAKMCLERIIEDMDKIPAQTLPILFGVLTEKAELLDGNATHRVDHKNKEKVSDLASIIQRLGGKIEEANITGSSGQNIKQIGPPPPGSTIDMDPIKPQQEIKEDT